MKKIIVLVLFLFVITGCQSSSFGGGKNEITAEKVSNKFNTSEIKDKYKLENGNLKRAVKDNPKDKIEVEIGNVRGLLGAGEDEFTPDVKISRWDDEVSLTLHPKMLDSVLTKDKELTFEDEKVVFTTPKIEYQLYNIATSTEYPEGAFEYQVDLKEKPDTNIVSFDIETKGLDFFYQPELTAEEIAEGANRPDNVIGSYAVYASENKINYVGGKEYKAGKVGHIYRPKVVDSKGTEVWGDLKIDTDKGILSVTIPQEFLDKAVYPVMHAAGLTFGYTSAGVAERLIASIGCCPNYLNNQHSNPYTTTEAGTVTSLSGYVRTTDATHGEIDLGFYEVDSNGSNSHDLRTSSGHFDIGGTSTTWKTADVTDYVFTASNDYMVAVKGSLNSSGSGNVYIAYDTATIDVYFGQTTGASSAQNLANPLNDNALSFSDEKYSLYATYTASGGSTPAPSNAQDVFQFN